MGFVFGLFLALLAAAAQTNRSTGAVAGSAVDASGAVVAGARVTVRNPDTSAARSVSTGLDGRFSVAGLSPGTYTVRLEAAGFAPVTVKPFVLSAGQVVSQRFELRPAAATDSIEVKEEPEAIDTTAVNASVALGYERIEEAPARSRNYLNFVLAAPAVAPSAGSSSQRTMTGVRSPLGDSGFTFGGMRPRNNAIQIDGLDNRDETTGGNRVAVGLEMVQEFRVAAAAGGAEMGGAAGGLLNMITRSGVNVWHGDLTLFGQHERMNARQPGTGAERKARFRRIQPGVSANGPLRRDRLFVSGAVEHERESGEEWSNIPEQAAAAYKGALLGFYPTGARGTEASLKLNWQAGGKDAVSARHAYSRGRVRGEVQGPSNFADRSAQGSSLTTDHSLVGDWIRVASPRLVNDVRVQFAKREMELRPNGVGPMVEIPGAATFGQFAGMDSDRTERHYQVVENLSYAARGHRLSAGADLHLVALDASMRNRFAGVFVFPTVAALAAGRPELYVQAFGDPRTHPRTLPMGVWLQDRWDIRSGLMLETGLRFERQRMPRGISPSSDNAAPRLGLAWRPSPRRPLVARAAFGLFYDRYPLAYLNDAIQKDGVHAFELFAAGDAAARAWDAARGTGSAPVPRLPASTYRTSAHFPSTHARKFTAGFEHGLGNDTSIGVEASHIRGFHLPRTRNAAGALQPRYELEQTARSAYAGATVTLNRRMSRELAYLIAYNFGRTRDDGSDFDEHPADPFDIRRDWSLSRQHQRHRLAASAVFELPVDALEDVSFAPVFSAGSGRPVNPLTVDGAGLAGAFPIAARPPGFARNSFPGPASVSLDLRAMKTIKVMEGRAILQFGVESFNLLNHTNTERVSQYYSAGGARLASFRRSLENLPARQVQLLVQFEY